MEHTHLRTAVENAAARALATHGPHGVNVAAVSMARVKDDNEIWLFNFFMNKTTKNVQSDPQVALSCWNGLQGIQVKGSVEYVTDGDRFEEAVAWVAEQNPERVVKGLLVLSPAAVYDLSAGENAGQPLSAAD